MIPIVTDSSCTLPPDLHPPARAAIHVVRTAITFGNETWVEGDFTLDDFYARVRHGGKHPRSSQPSPEEFLAAFGAAARQGPALGIFLSAALR